MDLFAVELATLDDGASIPPSGHDLRDEPAGERGREQQGRHEREQRAEGASGHRWMISRSR